ncbi:AAA family ATPase [Candidatus Amarobacter glycogenicus]|uniref:AAA family ATPase n=1 Tax=Candidatus Amarobacter glycogenicus TaxID=3140699 RepID=UPI0031364D5D|nr:adenylate kinase [Dehalococcoidia bacterium]
MDTPGAHPGSLGHRIVVVGPSCSGKSTLASQLAALSGASFIELDALFWKPNWQESDPEEFRMRLVEAHAADTWVTAGNYLRHTLATVWPRADTIIWLDFPLYLTSWRVVVRSWRRWRSRELLWGTNAEKFWDQLMIWSPQRSLIGYTISRRRQSRAAFLEAMTDPQFRQVRFLRLTSQGEVSTLLARAARAV